MVDQTMSKHRVPLCGLFYLCVLDITLFALKLSLEKQYFRLNTLQSALA